MTTAWRIELPTGIGLNVVTAGDPANRPLILLHGFPESHRTWRGIAPLLADRFFLIMPDQRGYGASDLPSDVADYRPEALIADIFALAQAFELQQFALVGHDWGGAIAWAAALASPEQVAKLAVINSPHPWIFQKTLIENPAQRSASQYINLFRKPEIEDVIRWKGFEWFFERSLGDHVDIATIDPEERARYLSDWSRPGALTAMLNWYRATGLIVPLPGADMAEPRWMKRFPGLKVPTVVIWAMEDRALLPVQLDGLDAWVEDLAIVRIEEAGHFVPWERPDEVAAALLAFL